MVELSDQNENLLRALVCTRSVPHGLLQALCT